MSSGIPELLTAFGTENHELPKEFMTNFNNRLQKILEGDDLFLDSRELYVGELFKDVCKVLSGEEFPSLLNSETQVADLILMIYLRVNKCYQKRLGSDQEAIWNGLVDHVRALFIVIIRDAIEQSHANRDTYSLLGQLNKLIIDLSSRSLPKPLSAKDPDQQDSEQSDADSNEDWLEDWAKYWNLESYMIEKSYTQSVVERQIAIHQLWMSERTYTKGLAVVTAFYHDDLIDDPAIKEDGQRFEFVEEAFSQIEKLKELHEIFLFALENRIKTQGPLVVGLSDIIRDWVPRAAECYTQYAESSPLTHFLIQQEASRNLYFKRTFDSGDATIKWLKYFLSPSSRIQSYTSLLANISEKTMEGSEERASLQSACEDFKALLERFSQAKARGYRRVRLREIDEALVLPISMGQVNFHLDDENRRLVHEGPLERPQTSIDNAPSAAYALLFDHYFVLAKQYHKGIGDETGNEEYQITEPVSILYTLGQPKSKSKSLTIDSRFLWLF